MLGALYGALSPEARASMRYTVAFPFHSTAARTADAASA